MHRQGKSEMTDAGLWVFAYGSLMWRPGFDFAERRVATLQGYRRRFCMTSVHYRGTPERPGLVLALDADEAGHCAGVVYRVEGPHSAATLAYLRERELVSYAYCEIIHEVELDDGRRVEALVYVSDRGHPQYLGGLTIEEQADVISRAVGPMGPNAEYLMNTIESLDALGVADPDLQQLATLVRGRL
jgi:glutathione-specific gamma-glutamylcyclotransferase